jgi:threonine dehydratase
MITKDDIDAARARIRPHVHETPLLTSTRLGNRAGGIHLRLKCESMQRTGSFKARGALNAMMQLTHAEKARGVVTVSAGNHAQALAWAAGMVGAECIAVMPEGASRTKIQATEGYGGKVELVGGERQKSFERAQEIASQGRVLVHPFEDARVAAGQGTVALELLEQCPDLHTVVVPIGGGGLISGMAVAIKSAKPDVRVIGVEPVGAQTMRKSLDAGMPQNISPNTVADGLAAPMVGAMTLDAVRRYVDDVVIVTDEEILAALRDLLGYAKLVVEPAGAAAVAALLTGKIPVERGTHVAAVISGGNIDLDRLKSLL